MFLAIIVTALVTSMTAIIIWLVMQNKKNTAAIDQLQHDNRLAGQRIQQYEKQALDSRIQAAYSQGLYEARETDTLYRQFLSGIQKGDQVRVIMNGAQYEPERNKK